MLASFGAQLDKIKNEIAAVVVVMVADFAFLGVAFANREKFIFWEFWLLISFIQVMTMIVCRDLLWHGERKKLSSQVGDDPPKDKK